MSVAARAVLGSRRAGCPAAAVLVPSLVAEKIAEAAGIAAQAGATTVPAPVETSLSKSRADEAPGGTWRRHPARTHRAAGCRATGPSQGRRAESCQLLDVSKPASSTTAATVSRSSSPPRRERSGRSRADVGPEGFEAVHARHSLRLPTGAGPPAGLRLRRSPRSVGHPHFPRPRWYPSTVGGPERAWLTDGRRLRVSLEPAPRPDRRHGGPARVVSGHRAALLYGAALAEAAPRPRRTGRSAVRYHWSC